MVAFDAGWLTNWLKTTNVWPKSFMWSFSDIVNRFSVLCWHPIKSFKVSCLRILSLNAYVSSWSGIFCVRAFSFLFITCVIGSLFYISFLCYSWSSSSCLNVLSSASFCCFSCYELNLSLIWDIFCVLLTTPYLCVSAGNCPFIMSGDFSWKCSNMNDPISESFAPKWWYSERF